MLKGFIINGKNVEDWEIHPGKYPVSLLRTIFNGEKDISDTLSVTQALVGTREIYYRLHHDYYIDPADIVPSLAGRAIHAIIEPGEECVLELPLVSGTADLVEVVGDKWYLFDYKLLGGYSMAKYLGLKTEYQWAGEYYKSGKKKGEKKMVKQTVFGEPDQNDCWDYWYQLNRYRIEIQNLLASGKPAEESGEGFLKQEKVLKLCAGKEFGGMRLAMMFRGSKMESDMYRLPSSLEVVKVPVIDDEVINAFVKSKNDQWFSALNGGEVPDCTDEETWNGRKCESFCVVSKYCTQKEKYIDASFA